MALTAEEQALFDEIIAWEKRYFSTPHQKLGRVTEQPEALHTLDSLLFFILSISQSPAWQNGMADTIIAEAQLLDESIQSIDQLRALPIQTLHQLIESQTSKASIRSLLHGSLTGLGKLPFIAVDLPIIIARHLRIVQSIALTFGYKVYHPTETLISLKVFYTATVPRRYQLLAWKTTEKEIQTLTHPFLYDAEDVIVDRYWLEGQAKQVAKWLLLRRFREKKIFRMPFVSIALGAGLNYYYAKNVANLATKFYMKRLLLERKQGS